MGLTLASSVKLSDKNASGGGRVKGIKRTDRSHDLSVLIRKALILISLVNYD
jgi:hypothetical protein